MMMQWANSRTEALVSPSPCLSRMALRMRRACLRAVAQVQAQPRGVATSCASASAGGSGPPPSPPNLELHRWGEGLRHGLPKFSGLATFFRQRFSETLEGVDVALVGVPFDGGANHPGTRLGPREIRNKSSVVRRVNQATGVAPFDSCRVADVGDAWVARPYGVSPSEPTDGLRSSHDEIQAFFAAVAAAGATPVTAGGVRAPSTGGCAVLSVVTVCPSNSGPVTRQDHSISLPILRALRAAVGRPLAMVHLDAHCDTAPPDEVGAATGSRYPNYTPFSCAVEEGLLDPSKVIQIGIRGPTSAGRMLSRDFGFRVVEMEEFYDAGARKVGALARSLVGDTPCYVTFDVDALDPAYALGTGSPEDGGLTTLEAQLLLRSLRGSRVVGTDFVCCSPVWDPTGNTPRVAAVMMFEQLCLVAEARQKFGSPFATHVK
jgi:guanidinopropionase